MAQMLPKHSISIVHAARGFATAAAVIFTTLATAIPTALAQQPPGPQLDQQIETMAVVNGQPITRQHLANECVRRFGEDVLKAIIKKQLVFNECQRLGIKITEKDINDEITARASEFRMSAEHWINLICGRRNLTPDRLKNDFIWHDVALRRLAADQIQVTKEELQRQIDIEYGSKVQVREIVCKDLESANKILALVSGENAQDFGTIAKDHSINPQSASIRGLLPPIARHVANPKMEQVVFALELGEVSEPIQVAEDQFVILKCERIFPKLELSEEQMLAVHERLVDQITQNKLSEVAAELARRLQNDAEIVNVHNDPELRQQYPGVAAIVNGIQVTKRYLAEECIAQFGIAMLSTEINRTLLKQTLAENSMQVSEEDISQEIMQAAEGLGYRGKDGEINQQAWLEFVTRGDTSKTVFYLEDQVWPSAALKKLVTPSVKVSEEDMKKGFESNYGPRVEALMIVFNEHRTATKVWQMAMADQSEDYFGKLANQYSVDPTSQANFGEVQPIQRHIGMSQLENEAFRLTKGEISNVVQVGEQYVVLMCRGRTTPVIDNPDDVKEHLHRDIFEKKLKIAMGKYFENMNNEAQIDNFLVGTSQAGRSARLPNRQAEATHTRLPFKQR